MLAVCLLLFFASCICQQQQPQNQQHQQPQQQQHKQSMTPKFKQAQQISRRDINNGGNKKLCELESSAFIRRVLDESFYPVYAKYNLAVPNTCPFHKTRNIFHVVEQNRRYPHDGDRPKCGFCGKSFYTDTTFHHHVIRKHSDTFDTSNTTLCWGDYCNIFRCDVHISLAKDAQEHTDNCSPQKMMNLRGRCEKLMQTCLPATLKDYVYDSITDSICSPIHCSRYYIPSGETTPTQVLVYTVLTLLAMFLLVVGCCSAIDYYEHENYEQMTRDRSADRAKEIRENEMWNKIRFNNNRGEGRSRFARSAPEDVRINVH